MVYITYILSGYLLFNVRPEPRTSSFICLLSAKFLRHPKYSPGYLHMKSTFFHVAEALLKVIEARDPCCATHSRTVAVYTRLIAVEVNLALKEQERLYLAGLLHDVGKVGVRDASLTKPGKLSPAEWAEIKKHPVISYEILKEIPGLREVSLIVLHHHERFDGTGYPVGLQGEAIPWGARILTVADAFDAMTEDRIYRPKLDREAAVAELRRCAGSQFDPAAVAAFCRVLARREGQDVIFYDSANR